MNIYIIIFFINTNSVFYFGEIFLFRKSTIFVILPIR